jgi:hypothetical protein
MSEQQPVPPPKPLEQADDTMDGTQPWAAWIVAALGVILVVIVVYLALERANELARRQAAEQVVPIVGGMVVSSPAPTADAPATAPTMPPVTATLGTTVLGAAENGEAVPTETWEEEASSAPSAATDEPETPTPMPATSTPRAITRVPAVAPAVFAPGDVVITPGTRLTLYADATLDATVLDAIAPSTTLTVLEPSGDFTAYPVLRDGHNWVRVRAVDGLAGWIVADSVLAAP